MSPSFPVGRIGSSRRVCELASFLGRQATFSLYATRLLFSPCPGHRQAGLESEAQRLLSLSKKGEVVVPRLRSFRKRRALGHPQLPAHLQQRAGAGRERPWPRSLVCEKLANTHTYSQKGARDPSHHYHQKRVCRGRLSHPVI